jgi:hypothetical protein
VAAETPEDNPVRITNLWDLAREATEPPAEEQVTLRPGFTHGAPDTHTPYETGPKSLPKEDDDE